MTEACSPPDSDSDDLLRLAVLDRGPGIAEEQLAQVLELPRQQAAA